MATRKRISEHFIVEEFDCHDGSRVPGFAHEQLVEWARVWGEPLRRRFGPVTVHSGYRNGRYNAAVGGVAGSLHVYDAGVDGGYRAIRAGVAADVSCATGTPRDWAAWALAKTPMTVKRLGAMRGGVGRYSTFVHLDTGPSRTWSGS